MISELLLGGGIFAADQKLKKEAEEAQPEETSRNFCKNKIRISRHHNYGFAGNLGAETPAFVKMMSLILTGVISIVFAFTLTKRGSRLLKAGLALMLGGAFSNTYDRMKRGYVVDYVSINVGPKLLRKLIWNISDFAIIIGAMLTVIG